MSLPEILGSEWKGNANANVVFPCYAGERLVSGNVTYLVKLLSLTPFVNGPSTMAVASNSVVSRGDGSSGNLVWELIFLTDSMMIVCEQSSFQPLSVQEK